MEESKIINIINKYLVDIISTIFSQGYYDENLKTELVKRASENIKNGIVFDCTNPNIYGQFQPSRKKIILNNQVLNDELSILIYFTHMFLHAIDYNGKTEGFNTLKSNNYITIGKGINEGATHRKANDIAKKILKVKPIIKKQKQLNIKLESDLTNYQLEDKINKLYAKALGITYEEFLKINDLNKIIELEEKYNDSGVLVYNYIDNIYMLHERSWFDSEDYDKMINSFYNKNGYKAINNKKNVYIKDDGTTIVNPYKINIKSLLKSTNEKLIDLYIERCFTEGLINNKNDYIKLINDITKDFIIEYNLKDNDYENHYNKHIERIKNSKLHKL